jgi:hypothetical protein
MKLIAEVLDAVINGRMVARTIGDLWFSYHAR